MRKRTIVFPSDIDELAESLAAERGYTQAKGGVSRLLADLVWEEKQRKGVGSFKTPLAEIEKRLAALEKQKNSAANE